MQLHSFCCFLLLHSCCLRLVLTQCWLASAATVAWLRFPGFKNLFEVKFLRRNLRYHPPSSLFTLSPGCSLIVWCLVVNPPTEPLFHRATLSCELAGSSAASLCSSHPLHGAVELETTRNFCAWSCCAHECSDFAFYDFRRSLCRPDFPGTDQHSCLWTHKQLWWSPKH